MPYLVQNKRKDVLIFRNAGKDIVLPPGQAANVNTVDDFLFEDSERGDVDIIDAFGRLVTRQLYTVDEVLNRNASVKQGNFSQRPAFRTGIPVIYIASDLNMLLFNDGVKDKWLDSLGTEITDEYIVVNLNSSIANLILLGLI